MRDDSPAVQPGDHRVVTRQRRVARVPVASRCPSPAGRGDPGVCGRCEAVLQPFKPRPDRLPYLVLFVAPILEAAQLFQKAGEPLARILGESLGRRRNYKRPKQHKTKQNKSKTKGSGQNKGKTKGSGSFLG